MELGFLINQLTKSVLSHASSSDSRTTGLADTSWRWFDHTIFIHILLCMASILRQLTNQFFVEWHVNFKKLKFGMLLYHINIYKYVHCLAIYVVITIQAVALRRSRCIRYNKKCYSTSLNYSTTELKNCDLILCISLWTGQEPSSKWRSQTRALHEWDDHPCHRRWPEWRWLQWGQGTVRAHCCYSMCLHLFSCHKLFSHCN